MTNSIMEPDIETLRSAGVAEDDISHCVKVAEKAAEAYCRLEQEGKPSLGRQPSWSFSV